MKIKYLALAAFLITSSSGIKLLTDPYKTGNDLNHDEINESADIVTVSHEHFDHNNVSAVQGNPQVFKGGLGEVDGIKIKGISAYHDDIGGSWLGNNTVFCFKVDGINICHCGDLGHLFNEQQIKEAGKLDVLMVPVGGYTDLDARKATQLCNQLKPKVIMPMHYKTDKIHFPHKVLDVDEFLRGKDNVIRQDASEIEYTKGNLPDKTQIIVLKPAR